MKNLFIITTVFTVFLLQSCREDEIRQSPKVVFTIDYSFSSGCMTRNTVNDEIYNKFFEDHIKTREITPKHYYITFTNEETKQMTKVSGIWNDKSLIRLTEGNYIVDGESVNKSQLHYVMDSLVLSFNDNIEINKSTENINIKAGYNCSLIFFNAKDIKKVRYYAQNIYTTIDDYLQSIDGYFYGFVTKLPSYETSYIEITRKNDKVILIHTAGLGLENGKYYFFNDMTGGFDLEPMTPGN